MTRRTWLSIISTGVVASAATPPFYSAKQDLLHFLDASGTRHPVRSRRDFENRRAHILANMQQVMGPLPAPIAGTPRVENGQESDEGSFARRHIRYEAEPGDWVPAWIFLPKPKFPPCCALHMS